MSSHHHNHPDHHTHSSHQHGPTHDPSVHSPHRHNHANNPSHHPSLHSPESHSGPVPTTTPDRMATDPTTTRLNKTDPNVSDPSATYTSLDPSTAPHAPSTHKILGDIKGAVHGVTGSLQAATGTVFGQKHMAEKGFDKMSDEDVRLAAKTGKPPVGNDRRGSVPDSTATSTATPGAGAGAAAEHGTGLAHERT